MTDQPERPAINADITLGAIQRLNELERGFGRNIRIRAFELASSRGTGAGERPEITTADVMRAWRILVRNGSSGRVARLMETASWAYILIGLICAVAGLLWRYWSRILEAPGGPLVIIGAAALLVGLLFRAAILTRAWDSTTRSRNLDHRAGGDMSDHRQEP